VRSYRTLSPLPTNNKLLEGGLLSAALVVSSRYPGVTWHPALLKPGLSSPVINRSYNSGDDLADYGPDYTGGVLYMKALITEKPQTTECLGLYSETDPT